MRQPSPRRLILVGGTELEVEVPRIARRRRQSKIYMPVVPLVELDIANEQFPDLPGLPGSAAEWDDYIIGADTEAEAHTREGFDVFCSILSPRAFVAWCDQRQVDNDISARLEYIAANANRWEGRGSIADLANTWSLQLLVDAASSLYNLSSGSLDGAGNRLAGDLFGRLLGVGGGSGLLILHADASSIKPGLDLTMAIDAAVDDRVALRTRYAVSVVTMFCQAAWLMPTYSSWIRSGTAGSSEMFVWAVGPTGVQGLPTDQARHVAESSWVDSVAATAMVYRSAVSPADPHVP